MYKKIINSILTVIAFCLSVQSYAAEKRGFAIVVDPKSYQEAKNEINDYAKAIESLRK